MKLNLIDLNLFVVFDAVYTERNLTRAAERLSVTQPAISNALSRLRHSLNDQLFVRTPKEMKPTPMAENIVEPVRQALQLLNTSIQAGDFFDPTTAQITFNLSIAYVAESWVLPPLLNYLQKNAPGIALSSYDISRARIPAELAAGKLDLAVNAPLINDPNLNHTIIPGEPYVCILREDHPGVGNSLSLDQYLALDHIHVSSRRIGRGYVDTKLNKLGHRRRIQARVGNFQLLPELIKESDLALTAPERFARFEGLKSVALPFELTPDDLCIYWHKSADQDQASSWLRKTILTLLASKERADQTGGRALFKRLG